MMTGLRMTIDLTDKEELRLAFLRSLFNVFAKIQKRVFKPGRFVMKPRIGQSFIQPIRALGG